MRLTTSDNSFNVFYTIMTRFTELKKKALKSLIIKDSKTFCLSLVNESATFLIPKKVLYLNQNSVLQ